MDAVMTQDTLSGVIAAIATPVTETARPTSTRAIKLARYLLDNGCDGLNVLGTTGEATSFSLRRAQGGDERLQANGLPLDRLMVGTGAAAVCRRGRAHPPRRRARLCRRAGAAAVLLQRRAGRRAAAYIETIVQATADKPIPIYLYHFPAMSGLPWHVGLIRRLLDSFRPASWD